MPIPQDLESRQFTPATNGRQDITTTGFGETDAKSPMCEEYVRLLQECGLSRLAEETGPLEDVTGQEFLTMLRLAKDPNYRQLWSRQRVTNVETEEQLASRIGRRRCKIHDSTEDGFGISETSTPTTPGSTPKSPIIDRSPSPTPRSYRCTTKKFQYYGLCFAHRPLPILSISCYNPKSTNCHICCFGGSNELGEMVYLSSWE